MTEDKKKENEEKKEEEKGGEETKAEEKAEETKKAPQAKEEEAKGKKDVPEKFKNRKIIAALGEVEDGDEVVLTLTGRLNDGSLISSYLISLAPKRIAYHKILIRYNDISIIERNCCISINNTHSLKDSRA